VILKLICGGLCGVIQRRNVVKALRLGVLPLKSAGLVRASGFILFWVFSAKVQLGGWLNGRAGAVARNQN